MDFISGKFMVLDHSIGSQGDNAILTSNQMAPMTNSCLEFWYHINGPNVRKTGIEFFGLRKIEYNVRILVPYQCTKCRENRHGVLWFDENRIQYNVGGTFVYLLKKVALHCKISS